MVISILFYMPSFPANQARKARISRSGPGVVQMQVLEAAKPAPVPEHGLGVKV